MKKEDVKKVILEVAGNPDSGVVVQLADKWAEAIVGLSTGEYDTNAKDGDGDGKVQDGTRFERPTKETRTTVAKETR
jgi:hypothetical protein